MHVQFRGLANEVLITADHSFLKYTTKNEFLKSATRTPAAKALAPSAYSTYVCDIWGPCYSRVAHT